MSAQTDRAGAGRADPAEGSSPDGAAADSADSESAGQSWSLSAKVVHPALIGKRMACPGKAADGLTPSLGHRIPKGTLSYAPDTETVCRRAAGPGNTWLCEGDRLGA